LSPARRDATGLGREDGGDVYALGATAPRIDPTAYVAPGAVVVGSAVLAAAASVWFGAIVRADDERVEIGEGTNVQDGAVLHADPGFPVVLGARTSVGHHAVVHGAFVGDACLVGIGARVLNGARIGAGSIVGAGAVVTPGCLVPDLVLVLGVPARVVRPLGEEERERVRATAERYIARAARYRAELVLKPR
jgi:carbonic anhydrase/acetyltransferase-like protein (isoleucine patch superfamily)